MGALGEKKIRTNVVAHKLIYIDLPMHLKTTELGT